MRIKGPLSIILFLQVFLLSSQDSYVRLLNQLKKAQNDTDRAKILVNLTAVAPEGEWEKFNSEAEILAYKLQGSNLLSEKLVGLSTLCTVANNYGYYFNMIGRREQALQFYSVSKELAEFLNDSLLLADNLTNTGNLYFKMGDHDSAEEFYLDAYNLLKNKTKDPTLGTVINNIAVIFEEEGNIPLAIEYQLKSMALNENNKDTLGLSYSFHNIGKLYLKLNDLQQALINLNKGFELRKRLGNIRKMASSLNEISNVYYLMGKDKLAVEYMNKALNLRLATGIKPEIAESYNKIAEYHNSKKNYELSKIYAEKALDIYLSARDKSGIASSYLILAESKKQSGLLDEALNYAYRSNELANQLKSLQLRTSTCQKIAEINELKGNHEEAYKYFKLYLNLHDSLTDSENSNIMLHHQMQYKHEKKLLEINQKDEQEDKIRNEHNNLIKIAFLVAIFFTLVVIVLIFIAWKRFSISSRQKLIINEQKALLENKNGIIVESIEYARVIQKNILKGEFELQDVFNDVFIINKPKDFVSGDFYWNKRVSETCILLAIADCTGHGVPGAFMTFVGSQLLDEIVEMELIYAPDQIINRLNDKIHALLENQENRSVEGMEIAILRIDTSNRKMEYSGAGINLYYSKEKEILELKTEYPAIGFIHSKEQKAKIEKIDIEENTKVYLSTDGFRDQKSADGKSKFFKKRLIELIQVNLDATMQVQKKIFIDELEKFKGNSEQTDDIMCIGFKL